MRGGGEVDFCGVKKDYRAVGEEEQEKEQEEKEQEEEEIIEC